MPRVDSTYCNLEFIGFPDYAVGTDGSVWTKRRRGPGLKVSEIIADEIRKKYLAGGFSSRELARQFGCSKSTVNSILNEVGRDEPVWKQLTPASSDRIGYIWVRLQNDEISKRFFVHHLVLLAFHGPRPEGMEARHFPDRNPKNNSSTNLLWGTKEENYQDKIVHGTHFKHNQNPNAKLTWDDVREVRRLASEKVLTHQRIAERFGVSLANVSAIIYYKTWREESCQAF